MTMEPCCFQWDVNDLLKQGFLMLASRPPARNQVLPEMYSKPAVSVLFLQIFAKNNTLKANHGVLPREMNEKASPERDLSIACSGSLRRWAFLAVEIKIEKFSEISRSHRKPRPGMSTMDFWHHFNGIIDSLGEDLSNGRNQVQWDQESREKAWFDILKRAKFSLLRRIGFSVRTQLAARGKQASK